MENFIQLKKDDILRIGIKDSDGKDTGNFLEFDLEDIEIPLRLSQCEFEHKKNLEFIKMKKTILDKKEDKKGKGLFTENEREWFKILKEFYNREEKALDLFLGENGTKKLLNGRNPYFSMYDDISNMLEPIIPLLNIKMENIEKKIKEKYSTVKKEDNVLE